MNCEQVAGAYLSVSSTKEAVAAAARAKGAREFAISL